MYYYFIVMLLYKSQHFRPNFITLQIVFFFNVLQLVYYISAVSGLKNKLYCDYHCDMFL